MSTRHETFPWQKRRREPLPSRKLRRFNRIQTILQCLDNLLIRATSESLFLREVREFCVLCRNRNFKMHAFKTHAFLRETKFCGRVLYADGIRFDPCLFDSIPHMRTPNIGSDLQQILCPANAMRPAISPHSFCAAPFPPRIRINSNWGPNETWRE